MLPEYKSILNRYYVNIVEKGWGEERWIVNTNDYCAKLLIFNKDSKISMHYHMIKNETWYVQEGSFLFKYIDTFSGQEKSETLLAGAIVDIPRGLPHQLISVKGGVIYEVSTEHFEDDSYRIKPGDSQL